MIKWLSKLLGVRTVAAPSTEGQSEFTAEVVRITSVSPHLNADSLELVNFEMASGPSTYQVVSQKNTLSVGDLAVYFSVDCVLPVSHPDFAFLAKRLDGVGKTHYRLRAARLRGVFSQGLLTPCTAGHTFGQKVATEYGVTYHVDNLQDPHPACRGQHPKKTKAQPMPVYGVESLKKAPHLFTPGEPVRITEKIHGTNFRFGWVPRRLLGFIPFGYKFVCGSHRTIREAKSAGTYYGEDLYLLAAQRMALAAATRDSRGRVFYGKLYGYTYSGAPIQDLTYGRKPVDGPGLVVFDVFDVEANEWLTPGERDYLLVQADLDGPPILGSRIPWTENLDSYLAGDTCIDHRVSCLHERTVREGVVIESSTKPRRKAKFVSQAYLLRKGA